MTGKHCRIPCCRPWAILWTLATATLATGQTGFGFGPSTYLSRVATLDNGHAIASGDPSFVNAPIPFLRIDPTGFVHWARALPNDGVHGYGFSVATDDSTGNIAISGTCLDPDQIPRPSLIVLSPDGDQLWSRYFTGAFPTPPLLAVRSDGAIAALTFVDGSSDLRIHLLSVNGSPLWVREYSGWSDPVRPSITATLDGGFLITDHAELVRLDGQGQILWGDALASSDPDTEVGGHSCALDLGNAIVQCFRSHAFSAPMNDHVTIVIRNPDGSMVSQERVIVDGGLEPSVDLIATGTDRYALNIGRPPYFQYVLERTLAGLPQRSFSWQFGGYAPMEIAATTTGALWVGVQGLKSPDPIWGTFHLPYGSPPPSCFDSWSPEYASIALVTTPAALSSAASSEPAIDHVEVISDLELSPVEFCSGQTSIDMVMPSTTNAAQPSVHGDVLLIPSSWNHGLLNIIDATGKVVMTMPLNASRLDLGTLELPSGIYLLRSMASPGAWYARFFKV